MASRFYHLHSSPAVGQLVDGKRFLLRRQDRSLKLSEYADAPCSEPPRRKTQYRHYFRHLSYQLLSSNNACCRPDGVVHTVTNRGGHYWTGQMKRCGISPSFGISAFTILASGCYSQPVYRPKDLYSELIWVLQAVQAPIRLHQSPSSVVFSASAGYS